MAAMIDRLHLSIQIRENQLYTTTKSSKSESVVENDLNGLSAEIFSSVDKNLSKFWKEEQLSGDEVVWVSLVVGEGYFDVELSSVTATDS